eukprot:719506-Pyramimonas_sp.AAC.1
MGPASAPPPAGAQASGPTARPQTPAVGSRDLAPREAEEHEGIEKDADYDGNPEKVAPARAPARKGLSTEAEVEQNEAAGHAAFRDWREDCCAARGF